MNMKKSFLSVLLSAIFLARTILAGAAVIDKVEEFEVAGRPTVKKVVISGQVPVADEEKEAGSQVFLQVYKKGVKEIGTGMNTDFLEYMAQTTADPNGHYAFEYMKDSDSGDYLVRVNYNLSQSSPGTTTHYYLSPVDFINFFAEISDILAKNGTAGYDAVTKLKSVLIDYSGRGILNIEKMQEMLHAGLDMTEIMEYMLEADGYDTLDEVVEAFNVGYVLMRLSHGDKDALSGYLDTDFYTGILALNDEVYNTYTELPAGKAGGVCTALSGKRYESLEQFGRDFVNAVLVESLKGVMWQAVYDILHSNNSAIHIDFSAYNNLGDKNNALIRFADAMSQESSVEGIKQLFERCVSAVPNTGSTSASSKAKGGKSSGTGGYYEVAPPKTAEAGFLDLESVEWAREPILELTKQGVVSGDESGRFRPNDTITREEFVKLVVEAMKLPDRQPGGKAFSDVGEGVWYKQYVDAAVNAGIIHGVSPDLFGAGMNIKRADVAVIVRKVLSIFGKEFTPKNIVYIDVEENYAFDSIYAVAEAKLMNGTSENTFEPERSLTRAEAAKVVYNLMRSKGEYVK